MKGSKPNLVLFHEKCPDGFGAAFAAWLALGDSADYIPAQYARPLTGVEFQDRNIYILDFSFDPDVLTAMSAQAKSLVLLDHHLSASNKLKGFRPLCCGKVHFDLERSGAVLAWKHFHPQTPVPFMFQCIESRDLWRWDVPNDADFLSWLDSEPQDFNAWNAVLNASQEELTRGIERGAAMDKKFWLLCESIAEAAVPVRVGDVEGLAVNASVEFVSEVGSLLAKRSGTFGLVWRVLPDRRVKCSLRGSQSFSVLELAEKFGGGGHLAAASFHLPTNRLMDLVSGSLVP